MPTDYSKRSMQPALPIVGPAVPRRGNRFSRWLGRTALRLFGWRIEGEALPDVSKTVLIGAPHTSNWDFIGGVGAMVGLGLDIGWLGKHTLFRRPFGWFMRLLGGIPVNRREAGGVVAESAEAFRQRDKLWLALAPEGTRRGGNWKSGFYRIAKAANVPILLIAIDARLRRIEIGPLLQPGSDEAGDWRRITAFYEPHLARRGRRLVR